MKNITKIANYIKSSSPKMEVIRKDSPFGNMKWLLLITSPSGGKSKEWFKTEKEANDAMERKEKMFNTNKYTSKSLQSTSVAPTHCKIVNDDRSLPNREYWTGKDFIIKGKEPKFFSNKAEAQHEIDKVILPKKDEFKPKVVEKNLDIIGYKLDNYNRVIEVVLNK